MSFSKAASDSKPKRISLLTQTSLFHISTFRLTNLSKIAINKAKTISITWYYPFLRRPVSRINHLISELWGTELALGNNVKTNERTLDT